jgi:hypothetical protein
VIRLSDEPGTPVFTSIKMHTPRVVTNFWSRLRPTRDD